MGLTLNEYQERARKTANLQEDIPRLINWVLGLVGEAGEFSEIELRSDGWQEAFDSEIGDLWWYSANIVTELGTTLSDLLHTNDPQLLDLGEGEAFNPSSDYPIRLHILTHACKIAELTKKRIFHAKPIPDEEIYRHLRTVLLSTGLMLNIWRTALGDVLEANLKKLEARHGDGFKEGV